MLSPADLDVLLRDLRARLDALYGERLVRLVLYGSYARGEATEESDVDVLAVLSGEVRVAREIRRMDQVRTRLLLDHGAVVSMIPISESEYQAASYPLIQSAHQDGVAV